MIPEPMRFETLFSHQRAHMIKRRCHIAVCLLIGWLAWATAAVALDQEPLRVAVDGAYPPYMYGNSPAKGLYPEIIRAAFSAAGISVALTGYPWKRALSLGRDGKAAVGGIYQNLARMAVFDYSDPIYRETLRVVVKAGRAFPFRGVVDLGGRRVGINRGWSYGEVFDSARRAGLFSAEEATDDQANLTKLILGRVDCVIVDELSLSQIVERMGWEDKVELLDLPAAVNSVHLVFAKHSGKRQILERFNQGLVEIKKNGTYNRIAIRFTQPTDDR